MQETSLAFSSRLKGVCTESLITPLLAVPLYKETWNVLPQGWGLFGHKDKTDIQQIQQ